MSKSYMGDKKSEQVAWAAQFVRVVGSTPAAYGAPATLMTEFTALNTALQAAWLLSSQVETRTRGTIAATDSSLSAMKALAKSLVSIIQGTPGVTDQMKIDAGLTVRKTTPSKKPAPTTAPKLSVVAQSGRNVTIELANADSTKRAKPVDAQNALVFTHVGSQLPQDQSLWVFYATTTSRQLQIAFPPSTTGDKVFITAQWVNAKSQTGPAAQPLSVELPAGVPLPQAAAKNTPMRKAA